MIAFPDAVGAAGWQRQEPATLGMDAAALARLRNYAVTSEIDWPLNVGGMVARNDPAPYRRPIGPVKPRGGASGLVVRNGCIVAEWGTPERVEMAFSTTKSYLSACVGLALDRGLIGGVDEPVARAVPNGLFLVPAANRAVTWRHLLNQTSEWSGAMFGIPDTVDHNRRVDQDVGGAGKGQPRALRTPGTYWEYNDVRVNALALAALHVWRAPLPAVLEREIMAPIGASDGWRWHPYDNAWVDVAGERLPSVPGGGHWGGGLWMDAFDHARYGLLMLARGRWRGRRLLSERWLADALAPCAANPRYGFLWWLNTGRKAWPAASRDAFAALGAGGNLVWVEPAADLVLVARWAGDPDGLVARALDALA